MSKKMLLGAATVSLLAISSAASAAPVLTISSEGESAADSAKNTFDSTFQNVFIESFEGPSKGNFGTDKTFSSVGTFTQDSAGSGGICGDGGRSCTGLRIDDDSSTPYTGRFATQGSQWLDSNDSTEMRWDRTSPTGVSSVNAVGFYITDANDAGGRMDVTTTDGSMLSTNSNDIFGSDLANGTELFLTISTCNETDVIEQISWAPNDSSDGFGIDGFRIGEVSSGGGQQIPLPSTVALLGVGLIAAGFIGRRTRGCVS